MDKGIKIEIVTGFACNNFCKFCSVGNRDFNKTTDVVKKEIDEAVAEHPRELNFTGGEPTIRRDIVELISYAKEKMQEIRITTNGRMLSYPEFTKTLVDAGLTGAIFSIHSHRAGIHDYLTSVKGCFEQATKGMKNLSEHSGNISINTVINSMNYKNLPDLAKMLLKFNISSLCLIYPTIDGNLLDNMHLLPKYSDVSKKVVETIDLVNAQGIPIWALNLPACFLPGFEKLSSIMKMKTKMYWPDMKTDLDVKKYENTIKPEQCDGCKLRKICPGIPKKYAEKHGSSEVTPVKREVKLEY